MTAYEDAQEYAILTNGYYRLRRVAGDLREILDRNVWEDALTSDEEDRLGDAMAIICDVRDRVQQRRDDLGDHLEKEEQP